VVRGDCDAAGEKPASAIAKKIGIAKKVIRLTSISSFPVNDSDGILLDQLVK
jgi:hypothetical protein